MRLRRVRGKPESDKIDREYFEIIAGSVPIMRSGANLPIPLT